MVRFTLGKVDAHRFYMKAINRVQGSNKGGLGWSTESFEAVDWETLARVTKINSKGFQLWLSKQAIGVCATQKNTARIQDILNNRCPNCGKQGEDNKHLNRCTDPGRIRLFQDRVGKLKRWMNKGHQTELELAFWVTQYLLHREQVRMANLAMLCPTSKTLQEGAESQDLISWGEFLHGKVLIKIHKIQEQEAHCIIADTRINGANWMMQFVRLLVESLTLNGCIETSPFITTQKGTYDSGRNKISGERWISLQTQGHWTSPLLELPQRPLTSSSSVHDAYWILALRVAKTTCSREEREYARSGTRA